jgi:two-component system heavy metal sensor histidine kinase CusS
MSLRRAETILRALGTRWYRLWGSIAGRLSILFGLASFTIVALVAGSLDIALRSSIYQDEAESLMDQIGAIAIVLRQDPDLAGPEGQAVRRQYSAVMNVDYVIRVLRTDGRIVFETPGLASLLPSKAFPVARSEPGAAPRPHTRRRDGRTFVTLTEAVAPATPAAGTRIVQLAYDGSQEAILAGRYRALTIAAILAGSVLSMLLGVYITRRALRPLTELTEVIRGVRATRLQQRLGHRPWPRELRTVAVAFDGMLDHLEAAVARLTQFAADLAHELRTPLNNLMGEAEVVLARPRSAADYREAIESSLEEYARLSRLTQELLFLARVGAGSETIQRQPLALEPLLQDIRELYEMVAEEQQVELRVEATGMIFASPDLLRRALINLMSNALRHTPRGGAIRLEGTEEESQSVIRVGDTGTGMPADDLPRVFDRFFSGAGKGEGGGSGLGLSIVKSIVELHEGRVWIDSALGSGTTVTLAFPKPPAAWRPEPGRSVA